MRCVRLRYAACKSPALDGGIMIRILVFVFLFSLAALADEHQPPRLHLGKDDNQALADALRALMTDKSAYESIQPFLKSYVRFEKDGSFRPPAGWNIETSDEVLSFVSNGKNNVQKKDEARFRIERTKDGVVKRFL